jgi:hypothetical protein
LDSGSDVDDDTTVSTPSKTVLGGPNS